MEVSDIKERVNKMENLLKSYINEINSGLYKVNKIESYSLVKVKGFITVIFTEKDFAFSNWYYSLEWKMIAINNEAFYNWVSNKRNLLIDSICTV